MAFESDFDDMLVDTVVYNATGSINAYGKHTHATANSSYPARITYKQKLVKAADGTEKISTVSALLNCTAALSINGKFTLPDGSAGPNLNIERISDTGGQHHVVVYFGGQATKG